MIRTVAVAALVTVLAAGLTAQTGAPSARAAALAPPAVTAGGTWTTLGTGLAGTGGSVPVLVGVGPLTPGSANTLELTDALPGGSSFLVLGFGTPIFIPFKGGTLWPNPDVVLVGLPIDGTGALDVPFTWPATVPAGFLFWTQHWIPDAGGPQGWASSNGVQGEGQ